MRNQPARMERKDDSVDIVGEVKKAVAPVMTAFESYKEANDARLADIAKKGAADPLLDEKLSRIDQRLDQYEGLSQKLATLDGNKKAMDELKEQFDRIETAVRRTGAGSSDDERKAARTGLWLKGVYLANTVGVMNLDSEVKKVFDDVAAEAKALSVSTDTAGGYLAPIEYVREIIKGVTEISPVRQLVRTYSTTSKSVQWPKRTGQFSAQWVAEQGTKSETTGLTYGLEEIPTHEMYALVDISNQMLEDSAFNMNDEINMEASEQFAVAEGAAVVSGTGVGKPEGWLTNSNVSETNSGSAATIADASGQANGLIGLKHGIKTAYTRNASWVMNRTTIGSVRKLKDGQGQYIWMPGIAQGRPNTIDGDPYVEVPDMPSEGANLYPIAYGDFRRFYVLVDRIVMEMLRDPYTQATSGNIRFVMRKRLGGQVVLPEAVRKLKCSA